VFQASSSKIDGSPGKIKVNIAVHEMDEMTQHNAALVEETNAAIEQTEAQANELDNIVDVFKIDDTAHSTSGATAKQIAA